MGEGIDQQQLAMIVATFCGVFMSIVLHEIAHAVAANYLGDDTARVLGRFSLNPFVHVDPFMTVILPIILLISTKGQFAFGGAKPVPVNAARFRNPKRDMAIVAIAGPITNILIAIVLAIVFNLILAFQVNTPLVRNILELTLNVLVINVLLALFNMIPIPPLDGSKVLGAFLPTDLWIKFMSIQNVGIFVVAALAFTGMLRFIVGPAKTMSIWLIELFSFIHG